MPGVPQRGIGSATVPGAPAGWVALAERFGTRPLRGAGRAGDPAWHATASSGLRGSPRITAWSEGLLRADPEAARIFLGDGPLRQPELAATLAGARRASIAGRSPPRRRRRSRPADFAAHRAEWVTPLREAFAGVEVCEMPPNSRGQLVLEARPSPGADRRVSRRTIPRCTRA